MTKKCLKLIVSFFIEIIPDAKPSFLKINNTFNSNLNKFVWIYFLFDEQITKIHKLNNSFCME